MFSMIPFQIPYSREEAYKDFKKIYDSRVTKILDNAFKQEILFEEIYNKSYADYVSVRAGLFISGTAACSIALIAVFLSLTDKFSGYDVICFFIAVLLLNIILFLYPKIDLKKYQKCKFNEQLFKSMRDVLKDKTVSSLKIREIKDIWSSVFPEFTSRM